MLKGNYMYAMLLSTLLLLMLSACGLPPMGVIKSDETRTEDAEGEDTEKNKQQQWKDEVAALDKKLAAERAKHRCFYARYSHFYGSHYQNQAHYWGLRVMVKNGWLVRFDVRPSARRPIDFTGAAGTVSAGNDLTYDSYQNWVKLKAGDLGAKEMPFKAKVKVMKDDVDIGGMFHGRLEKLFTGGNRVVDCCGDTIAFHPVGVKNHVLFIRDREGDANWWKNASGAQADNLCKDKEKIRKWIQARKKLNKKIDPDGTQAKADKAKGQCFYSFYDYYNGTSFSSNNAYHVALRTIVKGKRLVQLDVMQTARRPFNFGGVVGTATGDSLTVSGKKDGKIPFSANVKIMKDDVDHGGVYKGELTLNKAGNRVIGCCGGGLSSILVSEETKANDGYYQGFNYYMSNRIPDGKRVRTKIPDAAWWNSHAGADDLCEEDDGENE